jgi:hypothetical protein
MALTYKYVIRQSVNMLYYTGNISVDISDRWSPNFLDAQLYDTKALAEAEVENDEHGAIYFQVQEITIKS